LSPLSVREAALLSHLEGGNCHYRSHAEIIGEGELIKVSPIVLTGWACRVRYFRDGRRQILGFLIPGDIIHQSRAGLPSSATIAAVTHVSMAEAPVAEPSSSLARAYEVTAALEEFYLLRQVARLGRLNAYERVVDFLLEMNDRLAAAGLAVEDSFDFPITQELLADCLGLTSVHVNRTLQMMRREGVLELKGRTARVMNREALASFVEYRPPILL
jgi:CRP-like cAMP-binding protein